MIQIEQYTQEGYKERNGISRIIEFYRRLLKSASRKTHVSLGTPSFVSTGLATATFVIALLALVTAVASATIYVGPGEIETTIQGAVNNATEGDTIIVRDGTYTENVDVTKAVTIRSENGSATCTALDPLDPVFHVKADYVNIIGFTVMGANTEDYRAGIYLEGVNHCDISGNTISNNRAGIQLKSSNGNTISGNTISNNDYGVYLYASSTNTISGNTANSNYNSGIRLSGSNTNTISGNTVSNNEYGIYLMSRDNLIYNNYFNNTNNIREYGTNIWNITKIEGPNIIEGQYLGGNYWSDYAGEDLDGDGLGDTLLPYNSSGDIEASGDLEDGDIGDGRDWLPLVFVDHTPPAITNVSATSITMDSATISWDTDKPSDSLVKYGIVSSSYALTASDATVVTSHNISLTGLSASTTYFYVVASTDQNRNSVESSEYNFTTEAAHAVLRAQVVIKPETLNLNSKGKFFAFIKLPDGYKATDINISTVVCGGAPAIKGRAAHNNKYIVAIFARKDLIVVGPGPEVELSVTGNLNDGTPFEGSDTIRVIDRGRKKGGDTTKVVIEPETLNLNSKGKFFAFITLPDGYKATDVNISTMICEGAPAVNGWVAHPNKYTAMFDTEALIGIEPGSEVELTVMGNLEDGTPFEGSDTIRVIDKEEKKSNNDSDEKGKKKR